MYLDEAGTHDDAEWLVIGMLFVPSHGPLHADLLSVKKSLQFLNRTTRNASYAEFSLKNCRNAKSARVGQGFVDAFCSHDCYFRCLAFEWSMWRGKYFGQAFESDALKKRRAYKKWCEMLLHGERGALHLTDLILDELRIVRQYDVLDALKDRFTMNYRGECPWIKRFVHAKSWQDEHQCLQLCDLLTGGVYRALTRCDNHARSVVDHLRSKLLQIEGPRPILLGEASHWKGFHRRTLREHFPKFSQWVWKPSD